MKQPFLQSIILLKIFLKSRDIFRVPIARMTDMVSVIPTYDSEKSAQSLKMY